MNKSKGGRLPTTMIIIPESLSSEVVTSATYMEVYLPALTQLGWNIIIIASTK